MSEISGLPNRPLTIEEADALVESQKFVPLGIKQVLPNETPYTDEIDDVFADEAVNLVYSLLYATEDKAVSVAYSEADGEWKKAVEKTNVESYDPKEMEKETHEWVKNHNESDIDAGMVDVDEFVSEPEESNNG